jgi:hypothetical protein
MTDNNESNIVAANALARKRADILFEIAEAEKRAEQLRTELVHIDAVLRMLRPDLDLDALPVRHRRPTKSPYFAHGELTQRIFDALRRDGAAAVGDIATDAMRDKGLDPAHDEATRHDFAKRIGLQLQDMRRNGHVEKVGGRGPSARWRLVGG